MEGFNYFIIVVRKIISVILKIPYFICIKLLDLYRFVKYKQWKIFPYYGLEMYIGLFGAGKSIALTKRAYKICKRYPQVTLYTNYEIKNFPAHTKIIPLTNYQQIVDAPADSVFLISEISTIFNSRAWSKFPPDLLFQLLQNRKQKKYILADAQIFEHLDKQVRDILFYVHDCKMFLKRWGFITTYIASEYGNRTAVMMRPVPIRFTNYIYSDADRNRYNTDEMIDNFKKMEFLSSAEIMAKTEPKVVNINKISKSKLK